MRVGGTSSRAATIHIPSLLEYDSEDVDPADHNQRDGGAGQGAATEPADPHAAVDHPAPAGHESCRQQPWEGAFRIPKGAFVVVRHVYVLEAASVTRQGPMSFSWRGLVPGSAHFGLWGSG